MRKLMSVTLAVLMVSGSAWSASLNGSSWNVKVTPDAQAVAAGEKTFDDTLIFKEGKLTATACVKEGFAPSDYKPMSESKDSAFTALQTSAKQGSTDWHGAVQKTGSIEGTMVWTRLDGKIVHYTFAGKKRAGG